RAATLSWGPLRRRDRPRSTRGRRVEASARPDREAGGRFGRLGGGLWPRPSRSRPRPAEPGAGEGLDGVTGNRAGLEKRRLCDISWFRDRHPGTAGGERKTRVVKGVAMSATNKTGGFLEAEKAAIRERAAELKAEKGGKKKAQ